MPLRVIHYSRLAALKIGRLLNHLNCLYGNLAVYVLALVVVHIYLFSNVQCILLPS